ncbi:Vi polysaccharide biosynthesis UDP-N-acetylglucosamine C-6 dehydrogenase TviB [bacterium]|nr:Vi polysaccharide biosynthesis UDP-N-acetylglucosamine C-6 dehydrogenase TviB [bacterium]
MIEISDVNLAVIGLGYVGLPLAVEFGKHRSVIGFDINESRIVELRGGVDRTLEVSSDQLMSARYLEFTSEIDRLKTCNCFIVTVPTPVDRSNRPDLTPLINASRTVGRVLKSGDIVIYESTVYPGATEEDCVPILEAESGLKFWSGSDCDQTVPGFYCGYSPERINPGDKQRRLAQIVKVTSGSTPRAADLVDLLYREIIEVGTHKADSIRVAEASKVIENVQRDVNIAIVNELAIIFNRLGIDTEAVLKAAGTKWNFLNFRPGLVGGHCIGIDPYYLKYKAQSHGYHPEIISAVRRLNDGMGAYVVSQLVKLMVRRSIDIPNSRILVLGLTFKENCPDIRNTRVIDIVSELKEYGCAIDIFDPVADPGEIKAEYNLEMTDTPEPSRYDAIVIAVGHSVFREWGASKIRSFGKENHVVYDLKYLLSANESDLRL